MTQMNNSDPLSTCFRMPLKALELQEALLAAYGRLTQCDLILFLTLRNLPTQGSASELGRRLVKYDLDMYRGMEMEGGGEVQAEVNVIETRPNVVTTGNSSILLPLQLNGSGGNSSGRGLDSKVDSGSHGNGNGTFSKLDENVKIDVAKYETATATATADSDNKSHGRIRVIDRVPPEIWSEIFEHLGDWQIATALRIRTRLKRPWDWMRGATDLDVAILPGNLREVKKVMYKNSKDEPIKFTDAAADVMVRWGYVDLLDFFFRNSYRNFLEVFQKEWVPPNEVVLRMEIPWLASRYGQTKVLDWWLANSSPNPPPAHFAPLPTPNSVPLPPFYRKYDEGALNQASWKGYIHVLEWWKDSGLPLRIGDVMDWATIGGHISVLEWWKHSGQNTNIMHRDALCIASTRGKLEFLEWFRNSGLQLTYGNDILAIITKKNKPESLEWWAKSGLRIEYCISDIWEAIEDATTKVDGARDWWLARGVRFDGLDSEEWMRLRVL